MNRFPVDADYSPRQNRTLQSSSDADCSPRLRGGSALLIVLGMLSFMVISGVAFSVYMRASRLPSSFTRRVVSSRQLAKAALAEAIDQIDRAVANDPHPGVRNRFRSYTPANRTTMDSAGNTIEAFDADNIDNFWAGRILIGQGGSTDSLNSQTGVGVGDNIYYPKSVEPSDTVPVLTLEALAYLPPPLVNEARYYGQRTPTASWQTFDFDAGRYAYIAVDVSDYFDVHRILADLPRSSDPWTRVTMGHLFEDSAHGSAPDASSWKTFMDQFRSVSDDGVFSFDSTPPFVSLADFNLAFGGQSVGGMKSPFYQYVKSGGGSGFYGSVPGSSDYEKYREMTFVTDSLEAAVPDADMKTASGETVLDLDDESNQIFTEAFLDAAQENRPLLSVSQLKTEPFTSLIQKRVPLVTMFNLSDYLDCDRVPISLGIPSVERVPMICGIKPMIGASKVKVTMGTTPITAIPAPPASGTTPSPTPVEYEYYWRLDATSLAAGFMGGTVQALVVYPFRNHEKESESSFFSLDGKVQLFLSSETMRLRTGNADDLLHWAASGTTTSGKLMNNSVMNLPLAAQNITLPTDMTDPSKCVQQVSLDLSRSASAIADELAAEKGDVLKVRYKWTVTWNPTSSKWEPDYVGDGLVPTVGGTGGVTVEAASSALRPLQQGGTVDSDFSDDMRNVIPTLDKTLQLNAVVSLRVTSSDKAVRGEGSSGTKTVDMVPATLYDDKPLNDVDNSMGLSAAVFGSLSGEPTPLLKFDTGVSFKCKPDPASTCDADVKLTVANNKSASIMVDDPRYNHAPENWKVLDNFSPEGWLAATTAADRDGDIFMATSDQDYLQSVCEFAFLPRLSNLEQYGEAIRGDLSGYPAAGNSSWESLCLKDPIDRDFMWKTYDIFGRYSDDGDDFEGLGLENLGRGLKVNPYSNSASSILGAFANTPHDWRAASNNGDENPGANLAVAAFNQKYAWNEYSSGAKLSWAKVEDVADEFIYRVQQGFYAKDGKNDDYCLQNLSDSYRDVLDGAFRAFFGNATGNDAEKYLCGVDLSSDSKCSSVYSVDKKFLYGYWKSCFAARQQLYLVFFRAEPQALGGGVAGVTPPQLGARGVALVWRDPYDPHERKSTSGTVTRYYPNSSSSTGGNNVYFPHRTRILFYKQFE